MLKQTLHGRYASMLKHKWGWQGDIDEITVLTVCINQQGKSFKQIAIDNEMQQ